MLKVQVEREEKKAYFNNKLYIEEEPIGVKWVVKFTDDQLDHLYEENAPIIRDGEQWQQNVYEAIYTKMSGKFPKNKPFGPAMLEGQAEALESFFDAIVERCGLDKVQVEQTKLIMPGNEPKDVPAAKESTKKK